MLLKRLILIFVAFVSILLAQDATSYSFGVVAQRSAILTAQYWNPILQYISTKSGVHLVLKVARTGVESSDATQRGDYDFVYTNHIFQPKMSEANYQVILKPNSKAIRGQIVTMDNSSIHSLKELAGQEVGFPSAAAFVAYALTMDKLLREGVNVKPVFGGNQEGIMAQLKAGKVMAASVNNIIMQEYAHRENINYHVIWESDSFLNIPIASHPRVPHEASIAVQKAFAQMTDDPAGVKILENSAKLIAQALPLGFAVSSPKEYQNYRDFYTYTIIDALKKP